MNFAEKFKQIKMKNFKTNLAIFFALFVSFAYSQGKITGTILDSELNSGLPGVNIAVKGTTAGSTTDFDGKFSIDTPVNSGQLTITFIGFESKTITFSVEKNGLLNLGIIRLIPESNQLEEIVIKSSVIDIAKDRETPIAVSTIKSTEIVEKLGTQEFPEILNNTPSVYTTKSGGGFGDSRINIRGFSQENIAVMINGVPVNDMENSRVFWSNWAGLSDVTSAMQVQRGLGSSKLAISSVGGTINVVTKTSDLKRGGTISSTVGNDGYLKTLASLRQS
jgi:outer membrane receptor protein involved in Fe transport